MATTEILAIGVTAASSTDVVVVAGTPQTVSLKADADNGLPARAFAVVERKGADDNWYSVVNLTPRKSESLLWAPGTYRVRRGVRPTGQGFGADKAV